LSHTSARHPGQFCAKCPGCSFQPRNRIGNAELCLTDKSPALDEIQPGHFAQNCPGCLAEV
ncbi:MAG: hypothetical protein EOP85_06275, partial [Verrucomicrobiaceae bacterium]